MRHAGDESTKARHFFLFDQPRLSLLQIRVRAVQRFIGAA